MCLPHLKVAPFGRTLLTKPPRANLLVRVPLATDAAAPSPTTPLLSEENAQQLGVCEIDSFAAIASLAAIVALRTGAGRKQARPWNYCSWGCWFRDSGSNFEGSVNLENQELRHQRLFPESEIRNDGLIVPFELCCPDFHSAPEQKHEGMRLVNWREWTGSDSCHQRTCCVQD